MRKIVIPSPGGYRQLHIETTPEPQPGPADVLIDVAAIGVNYADCVTRMGLYASARHYLGYPITPGFEVSGTVQQCGTAVTGLAPGTRVIGITRFNAYATRLCIDRSQVFPIPATLSFTGAAALPTATLTAWYALHQLAHIQAGESVLVHSAAGGVGSMLVQLCKRSACRVTAVVGASHKVDSVRALGADTVIDKSVEPLWQVTERTTPGGFDVILDANRITTLQQSYRHLAPCGRLVIYGFHGMLRTQRGLPGKLRLAWDYLRTPRFSPFDLTSRNRSVLGFNLSYLFEQQALLDTGMQQILQWLESGELSVPPVRCYPFEAVAEAHRQLESGQTIGKLVLTC